MGTDLSITINGRQTQHITPDLMRHRAPAADRDADAFLRLEAVAAELDSEAGIVPPLARQEVAFSTSECSPWMHPTNTNYVSCCWDGYQTMGVRDNPSIPIVRNWNTNFSGWGCRASDGYSDCSGTGCYYGPCGFSAGFADNIAPYYARIDGSESGCNWVYDTNNPPAHDFGGVNGSCSAPPCP